MESSPQEGSRTPALPYQVGSTLNKLLTNVAALMEHPSRHLLDFSAANTIKTCEGLVLRIQETIREAERLGPGQPSMLAQPPLA